MTSENDALLANVAANPGDDLARLVYADWLEERGGEAEAARAEFIRLQITRSEQRMTLEPSDLELGYLHQFREQWHPDWPRNWHQAVDYDRGFPYNLSVDLGVGSKTPAALAPLVSGVLELETLQSLTITAGVIDPPRELSPILEEWGNTSRIKVLDLNVEWTGYTGIAEPQLWPGLRKVTFHGDSLNLFSPTFLKRQWRGVTDLTISRRWDGAELDHLLSEDIFLDAVELDISISSPVARTLTARRSAILDRARRLTLYLPFGELDNAVDVITSDRGEFHAAELRVSGSDQDCQRLTNCILSQPRGRIRVLALEQFVSRMGANSVLSTTAADAFVQALIESPVFAGLEHLDLESSPLSPGTTRRLIEAAAEVGILRLAVPLHCGEGAFGQFLNESRCFDRFTYFSLPAGYRFFDGLRPLANRLGPRICRDMTANYFAAQRRWNPL